MNTKRSTMTWTFRRPRIAEFESVKKELNSILAGKCGIKGCRSVDMYRADDQSKAYRAMLDRVDKLMESNGLENIGSGSSRDVYRINDKYVVKVAICDAGVAQNMNEIRFFKKRNSIFNRNVLASAKGYWVVARYAKPVTNKAIREGYGCSKKRFEEMMRYAIYRGNDISPRSKKLYETKYQYNKFFRSLTKLSSMGLVQDDYVDFCTGNYGVVNNRVVLIDGGLTEDIYEIFY